MASEPRHLNPLLVVALVIPIAVATVPLMSLLLSAVVSDGPHQSVDLQFPLYMVLPFAALLGSIALMPFAPHDVLHWWENNLNRLLIAVVLAIPIIVYMYATFGAHDTNIAMTYALEEYISFIVLLFTLYTISGGLHLQGNLKGTPLVNVTYLAIGTVLASAVGTTGASMLLIRPVLSSNKERAYVTHIYVFFIFLVSNIGGSLTPLGDPPLFLGFLRGVPFFWTLELLLPWAIASSVLLAIFFAVDKFYYAKENQANLTRDKSEAVPLRILGLEHAALLAAVIAVVLVTPALEHKLGGLSGHAKLWWVRDGFMVTLALISLKTGRPEIRWQKNGFNFHAMGEVAALFLGIFICMIPALAILKTNGKAGNIRIGEVAIEEPIHFMWATGICSALLDNAPTYLVYVSVAQGVLENKNAESLKKTGVPLTFKESERVEVYPYKPETLNLPNIYLLAISLGAVFFGALTYIGNAPNFMVNAICVSEGVSMPSFISYIGWSVLFLGPVYVLITYTTFVLGFH